MVSPSIHWWATKVIIVFAVACLMNVILAGISKALVYHVFQLTKFHEMNIYRGNFSMPILNLETVTIANYLCSEHGLNMQSSAELSQCKTMLAQTVRNAKILTISKLIQEYYSQVSNHGELFALTYAYESVASLKDSTRSGIDSEGGYAIDDLISMPNNQNVCLFGYPEYSTLVYILTLPNVKSVWVTATSAERQFAYVPLEHAKEIAAEFNTELNFQFTSDLSAQIHMMSSSIKNMRCDVIHVVDHSIEEVHQIVHALSHSGSDSDSYSDGDVEINDNSCLSGAGSCRFPNDQTATKVIRTHHFDASAPDFSYNHSESLRHPMNTHTLSASKTEPATPIVPIDWKLSSVWNRHGAISTTTDANGYTPRGYITGDDAFRQLITVVDIGVRSAQSRPSDQVEPDLVCNNRQRSGVTPADVIVVITYTIRVFAENAHGIHQALRTIGYIHTYTVPDPTLSAIHDLTQKYTQRTCDNINSIGSNQCSSSSACHGSSGGCSGCSPPHVVQILLGPHDMTVLLPRYIVFHMEQLWSEMTLGANSNFHHRYYHLLYNAAAVLTFSDGHRDSMRDLGFRNVHTVPMYTSNEVTGDNNSVSSNSDVSGDTSSSDQSEPSEYGIDVLFFGSCSVRRYNMITALQSLFADTPYIFTAFCGGWQHAIFDQQRDAFVSQSRIVLNLHTESDSVLEVHRINYLLSMGKCIVSERSADKNLDDLYSEGVVFVDTAGTITTSGDNSGGNSGDSDSDSDSGGSDGGINISGSGDGSDISSNVQCIFNVLVQLLSNEPAQKVVRMQAASVFELINSNTDSLELAMSEVVKLL